MSRPDLARLGGIAAVVGGLLYATVNALRLILTSLAEPSSPALLTLAALSLVVFPLVGIFAALCFATGLTGLYALLGRRSVVGILGLILAYLSILAVLLSIALSIYISYRAAANPDTGSDPREVLFAVGLTPTLLLAGGILFVGAAAFGARTLGRWRVLPLILGLLTLAVVVFPVLGSSLGWPVQPWSTIRELLVILQGLLWVLLGGVLLAHASPREAGNARSTA